MAIRLGQPIKHQDWMTEAVERQLLLYLYETIFGPLFGMLEDDGVKTDPAFQAIGSTPQMKNGADAWTLFEPGLRSLRLKRVEMPQIGAGDRQNFETYMATRGIERTEGTIYPGDLRPAQEGYWPENLARAQAHEGAERPVIVSRDWFILDGHHQWLAALLARPLKRISVVQYGAPIRALVSLAGNFPRATFKNASVDPVATAIERHDIWYAEGKFTGKFTAATSKQLRAMGAVWDASTRTFSIPLERLPMELRTAVAQSQEASAALHSQISNVLTNMGEALPNAPAALRYRKAVDKITDDLQKQFARTVPAIESISVPVVITPEMRAAIDRELTNNLELYIKKFAAEEIPELRGLVEQNAFDGGRTPQLARIIEARWGVSKRKAKFLADQETSLLVSKYREQTYKRIGIRRYMWSTAGDSRVRPTRPGETNNHRRLDGRIFTWDAPPVVDTGTGRRCHPGEDFGCRCTAVPVLDLPGVTVEP